MSYGEADDQIRDFAIRELEALADECRDVMPITVEELGSRLARVIAEINKRIRALRQSTTGQTNCLDKRGDL